jgi:hypothetical protein
MRHVLKQLNDCNPSDLQALDEPSLGVLRVCVRGGQKLPRLSAPVSVRLAT